jgi:CubicO group peptidase (beta-lactamase class C family)
MNLKTIASCGILLLACSVIWAQQPDSNSRAVLPTKAAIAKLEADIPSLLQQADVPGLSIALIRNGKLVWSGAFGVSNADTKKPVDVNTVFEAASL